MRTSDPDKIKVSRYIDRSALLSVLISLSSLFLLIFLIYCLIFYKDFNFAYAFVVYTFAICSVALVVIFFRSLKSVSSTSVLVLTRRGATVALGTGLVEPFGVVWQQRVAGAETGAGPWVVGWGDASTRAPLSLGSAPPPTWRVAVGWAGVVPEVRLWSVGALRSEVEPRWAPTGDAGFDAALRWSGEADGLGRLSPETRRFLVESLRAHGIVRLHLLPHALHLSLLLRAVPQRADALEVALTLAERLRGELLELGPVESRRLRCVDSAWLVQGALRRLPPSPPELGITPRLQSDSIQEARLPPWPDLFEASRGEEGVWVSWSTRWGVRFQLEARSPLALEQPTPFAARYHDLGAEQHLPPELEAALVRLFDAGWTFQVGLDHVLRTHIAASAVWSGALEERLWEACGAVAHLVRLSG